MDVSKPVCLVSRSNGKREKTKSSDRDGPNGGDFFGIFLAGWRRSKSLVRELADVGIIHRLQKKGIQGILCSHISSQD